MSRFAEQRYKLTSKFGDYIGRIKNTVNAQLGIKEIKTLGIEYKKYVGSKIIDILTSVKTHRMELNDSASVKAIDEAIIDINKAK